MHATRLAVRHHFVGVHAIHRLPWAAYRDVYTQKMAGEIRNLEDQLYQADYENQVLNDRLSRAEMRASQVQIPADARRRTFMGKTLDESGKHSMRAPEPREATPR